MIDRKLHLYDSLQSTTTLDIDTKTNLKNIYGDLDDYMDEDVTQQTGVVDCGLFAIAFITALCHGQRPEDYIFHQDQMRHHFLSCLDNKELIPFPATQKPIYQAPI